jgi:branched-chain amino acid transport system ATP-binding protein
LFRATKPSVRCPRPAPSSNERARIACIFVGVSLLKCAGFPEWDEGQGIWQFRNGKHLCGLWEASISDFILETTDLTKQFQGFIAVDKVCLKVKRGSIHALIGPNGAGKSTVFNLVTKFLQPTAGKILYKGEDITQAAPEDIALKGLVRSFQISAVFAHLSVRENVRMALQRRLGNWYKFWQSEKTLDVLNDRADELIESVGLSAFARMNAVELSYGRKRALEIITTLALDPEVMLLDEPMAGMGREDIDRVVRLIKRIAANRTVLMVEHNLSVVSALCDTITVLTRGRVLAEGSYAEVSRNSEVRTAYMGKAHA